jgi:hypothetical protein
MEIKYKDSDNNIHQIEEGFEHLMPSYPLGYTLITDEEADLITASKVVPPTYAELRATAYPPITDQLDTIYHEGVDAWKAVITAVKEEYPKT